MAEKNVFWRHVSLNTKVMVWFTAILLVMLLTIGTIIGIARATFNSFDVLVQSNVTCYALQNALDAERTAFEVYTREPSQESLRNLEEACAATEQCIDSLPFTYAQIGEERYARTWNIVHGYEGYRTFRDAFIAADSTAADYVDQLYRIMDMQEALSDYALRLVQATLDQSRQAYADSTDTFGAMPWFFVILLAAAIIAVASIMRILTKTAVRPLIRLAQESRRIAENDFSGEDPAVESSDEVGELTLAFNRMKHAMSEHLATLDALHREELAKLELEKNLDRTRLEMLKSQVNPHFLFNTLNMISCMARLEDAQTTNRMILSLGNLFRYNLRTKEQKVYLDQELEALDDYIYIQLMRFDSRVTYRKIIRVDPKAVKIPSFTLQPVVENAFVHGMSTVEENGIITLRIRQVGSNLIITIADNGRGMTPQELEKLRESIRNCEHTGRGIGLGNISRRITMLYHSAGMKIYSKPGRGTVIRFTIPQDEKREQNV